MKAVQQQTHWMQRSGSTNILGHLNLVDAFLRQRIQQVLWPKHFHSLHSQGLLDHLYTTSRSGETDTELAGTDEHACPDPPQRRATTSGSSQRRLVSELVANMQQLVNEGSAASDAQNAHKRERKYTGSEKSGERVTKPAPPDKSTTSTWSTQSRVTGSSTTSGSVESGIERAADDEDAPKCEKCGWTFPWNQLHLRWKHTWSNSHLRSLTATT